MQKSYIKRIKRTASGKFMRRSMAVNHCLTRKSTKNIRHKRMRRGIDLQPKKILAYAFSGVSTS